MHRCREYYLVLEWLKAERAYMPSSMSVMWHPIGQTVLLSYDIRGHCNLHAKEHRQFANDLWLLSLAAQLSQVERVAVIRCCVFTL